MHHGRTTIVAAVALLSCGAAPAQPGLGQDEMVKLSKSFLRDSAELPMDVGVTTVAKDAKGKVKRNAHSKIRFLFRGYNGETGRFSFRSNSSVFSTRLLRDSIGGNFAAIHAFTALAPKPGGPPELTVEGGGPFIVKAPAKACPAFVMTGKMMYPEKHCYSTEFRIRRDASGTLAIERFSEDAAGLPAAGNVPYLGAVQIRRVHAEGEVQEARLPNEPRPFLIPKRVILTIETDKGSVAVTNVYTLK